MCGTSARELPLIQNNSGCACCSPGHEAKAEDKAEDKAPQQTGQFKATYLVSGMTCGHCTASVTEELENLQGVSDVSVSLVSGGASTVTVQATGPLSEENIRSAVREAGYEFAGVA